ncbi:MAG: DUF5671 domain-containing protein [Chloroflexi bacterium]|nr:DUF5671 domain-containing protein [Chloroflexota bacterium]
MKTIRRLYFYLVALISLEVVIWGLINLLRTMFSSGLTFPGADTLAQALALICVGVPIFAAHWLWAQRVSEKDPEEHSATLRALFLYAALLATLIPVVQNLLALINRTLITSAGIDSYRTFVGGTQTWVDNIIAILLNLLAAGYFFNIQRTNWAALTEKENFADIRRLYRYIWVLYALLMTVFGTQQDIRFLFYLPSAVLGAQGRELYINGLALILVGTPVWVYCWNLCQKALDETTELGSTLRMAVLYILALAGVMVVLTTAGMIMNTLLLRLLGADLNWRELVSQIGSPFSVGLPLAVVWAYYGSWLTREIASVGDSTRQSALKRFYFYILSLVGLVATFVGLALLLSFIVTVLTGDALWGEVLRPRLTGAIATLLSGLPLWLSAWRPMQAEALASGDMGDHARRSIVRRSYLYLAIFATVIGGMASAIYLVYTILFGFLDHRSDSFITDVFNGVQLLSLFVAFLVYHWNVLRQDGGRAADALASRQALFAVLIFESQGSGFAAPLVGAIKRASGAIPVAVQTVEQGIPDGVSVVQAVVLPSSLALNPPEALRLWLKDFPGSKLVVPVDLPGWYWPGGALKNGPVVTAQILRQLAEGQEVRSSNGAPAWQTAAYVFAALFGLQILFLLFGLGISLIAGN